MNVEEKIEKIATEEILRLKDSIIGAPLKEVESLRGTIPFIKRFLNRIDEEFKTDTENMVDATYTDLHLNREDK